MNLLNFAQVKEVCAPVSASDAINSNSDRIDMTGWDGVLFIAPITDSVATGVATLTIEQNTIDSDTGMAALAGAVATATCVDTDDLNNKLLTVDVWRPRERYLQGVLTSSAANIAYGNMIAILYKNRKQPVTEDSTVLASAFVQSPAES